MLSPRVIFQSHEAITSIALAGDQILVAAARLISANLAAEHFETTGWDDVEQVKLIGQNKLLVMRHPHDYELYILDLNSGDSRHIRTHDGSNSSEPAICVDATGNGVINHSSEGAAVTFEKISLFGERTNLFGEYPQHVGDVIHAYPPSSGAIACYLRANKELAHDPRTA